MVIYECEKCTKIFNHKGTYDRHLNKKNPCKITIKSSIIEPIIEPIIESDKILIEYEEKSENNQCDKCLKIFYKKYNLMRHISEGRCRSKDDIIIQKVTILEDTNKKLCEKLKEMETLIKSCSITNNINKNSNNTTNITNNTNNTQTNNVVNINVYGKEDISHISNETYKQIFRRCKNSVPVYIKIKHFSDDKPENSNIYFSDIKSQYVSTFDGKQWNIADKKDLIEEMYDDNCDLLINKFEDIKNELDDVTIKKYNRFFETKDEPETKTTAQGEIKKILYNEREKALKNKKLTKNT
jgi:uncharacterized C2H2 Zn-finger protein